jgi:signal transduction histidine kinase/putative methionine-R-sulfoxide reductase with GAF domain
MSPGNVLVVSDDWEADWLALLGRIGRQIASASSTNQLLEEIVRLVWEAFDLYYARVVLLDGDLVKVQAAVGGEGDCPSPIEVCRHLTTSRDIIAQALIAGESLSVADLHCLESCTLPPEIARARSAVVVPVVLHDQPLGALEVLSAEPGAFESDDLSHFETLAAQLALAMQNARLIDAQQRHQETVQALNAAALAVQCVTVSQAKVLEGIASELSHSGFESLVHLLDPVSDSAHLSASSLSPRLAKALTGLLDAPPDNWPLDLAHAPTYRRVLEERQALFLLDIEALVGEIGPSGLANDGIALIAQILDGSHAVIAPLLLGDQALGWLTLFSSRLSAGDCPSATAFANQTAVALEKARLLADARHAVELVLLNEAGQAMAATLEFDEVLHLLLEAVAKVLQVDECVVALWDEAQQRHVPRARLSEGRALLTDLSDDDAETLASLPSVRVSLIEHDRTFGLLALNRHSDGSPLSAEDVQLAQALANQAASALENACLYTKLKRSAEELERSQQRLIQSEKLAATGRLAASIAHEINNPLQAIRNCLELIRDETEEGEPLDRTYLDVATSELERIRGIIQQMLDLYRPGQERMAPVDLNAAIEGVLALMRKQLQSHQIVVEAHLDDAMPQVIGHGDQLRQVFINLILNASEAMPDGGQLILTTGQDCDGFAVAQVIDTGEGIMSEDLTRIADPFFTTKPKGVGLGLTICHEIIERHQGTLDVTSRVGHGSTFIIRLPAVKSFDKGSFGGKSYGLTNSDCG